MMMKAFEPSLESVEQYLFGYRVMEPLESCFLMPDTDFLIKDAMLFEEQSELLRHANSIQRQLALVVSRSDIRECTRTPEVDAVLDYIANYQAKGLIASTFYGDETILAIKAGLVLGSFDHERIGECPTVATGVIIDCVLHLTPLIALSHPASTRLHCYAALKVVRMGLCT